MSRRFDSSSGFWARLVGSTQKSLRIVASTFHEAHSELSIVRFVIDGVDWKSLQEGDVHTYSLRHLPLPPAQNYPRSVLNLHHRLPPHFCQASKVLEDHYTRVSNRSPAPSRRVNPNQEKFSLGTEFLSSVTNNHEIDCGPLKHEAPHPLLLFRAAMCRSEKMAFWFLRTELRLGCFQHFGYAGALKKSLCP